MKRDESAKTREKNRIKDRKREREAPFSRSNLATIDHLETLEQTLHALCFVFELPGSIKWEEMERQVGIDDKPFSRFRSTLKEFLNGQITAERISSDTFERTRSN